MMRSSLYACVASLEAALARPPAHLDLAHLTDDELAIIAGVPRVGTEAYVNGLPDHDWLALSKALDRARAPVRA